MVAADPGQGGATWAVLQYLLGLAQLGHDVFLLEPVPLKSVQQPFTSLSVSDNARYFDRVVSRFGIADRSGLLLEGTRETHGSNYLDIERACRQADLLLNVSGMLQDESLLASIPTRVYLDLDPGFNQLWSEVEGINMRFSGHTHHVTIGQRIGEPGCLVPTCGLNWIKTLQPVVLNHWPAASPSDDEGEFLTGVGNWRGYGSIQHNGIRYGQRAHSFRQFFDLPMRTEERFLMALSIHPEETADLQALATNRWRLVDPAKVAGTPDSYQQFIKSSRAEFGVAKSGYVESRCGWFSDRSVCYLASGRPVIAQETGFSDFLPVGDGLLAFHDTSSALEAIDQLRSRYRHHRGMARVLAEDYFDSDKVLPQLLEKVGL